MAGNRSTGKSHGRALSARASSPRSEKLYRMVQNPLGMAFAAFARCAFWQYPSTANTRPAPA